jgi:hypothetical protein
MRTIRYARVFLSVVSSLLLATTVLYAGPPLICHPIQIGKARSLPSGNGSHGAKSDYDRTNLIEETLALLTPDMPVLVRMETLRRATLYASGIYRGNRGWTHRTQEDRRIAYELLARLMARALQEPGGNSPNYLATFDVGYLMACYEQAKLAEGFGGYELVKRALAMSGSNPELEFACAMVSIWPKRAEQAQHLQKARLAAEKNPLLAMNLKEHFGSAR